MGKLRSVFLLLITCINLCASKNLDDNQEIKNIIIKLYREPRKEFVSGRPLSKPDTYWINKYEKYYTKTIIDYFIVNSHKIGMSSNPLVDWDPRFYAALDEYEVIPKPRIVEISTQKKMKTAIVVYSTTWNRESFTYATFYYFERTALGWRISDQWLGRMIEKPWESASGLRRLFPESVTKFNRLLDCSLPDD